MKFDIEDSEDQYIGAVLLLGVTTVAYWCIGLYDLISSSSHLLHFVGPAFPFFGVALAAIFWSAYKRTREGGMLYYFCAGLFVGLAFLLAGQHMPSGSLGFALVAAGALFGVRGVIISLRARGNEPLSQEEHVGFILVAIWLVATLLSWNLLAAIRMAALLLVFWRLIPAIAHGYANLAEFLNNLLTPREIETETSTMETKYDDFGLEISDPFHDAKRRVCMFIRANYGKDWPYQEFQPTVTSPSYVTHILTKPDTIKYDVFSKREDDLTTALRLENKTLIITLDGTRGAFLLQIALPKDQIRPTFFERLTEPVGPGMKPDEARMYAGIQKALRKPYEFVAGLNPFS